MYSDLTVELYPEKWPYGVEDFSKRLYEGHIGTHIDLLGHEFPLESCCLPGVVFDVRDASGGVVRKTDIQVESLPSGAFACFHTGHMDTYGYGTEEYFESHPVLSEGLVEELVDAGVKLIGIDGPGLRKGPAHRKIDEYCAERGVFVVENMCNLKSVPNLLSPDPELIPYGKTFFNTFPMNIRGASGVPCRIIAEFQL